MFFWNLGLKLHIMMVLPIFNFYEKNNFLIAGNKNYFINHSEKKLISKTWFLTKYQFF